MHRTQKYGWINVLLMVTTIVAFNLPAVSSAKEMSLFSSGDTQSTSLFLRQAKLTLNPGSNGSFTKISKEKTWKSQPLSGIFDHYGESTFVLLIGIRTDSPIKIPVEVAFVSPEGETYSLLYTCIIHGGIPVEACFKPHPTGFRGIPPLSVEGFTVELHVYNEMPDRPLFTYVNASFSQAKSFQPRVIIPSSTEGATTH